MKQTPDPMPKMSDEALSVLGPIQLARGDAIGHQQGSPLVNRDPEEMRMGLDHRDHVVEAIALDRI